MRPKEDLSDRNGSPSRVRTPVARSTLLLLALGLAVGACSDSSSSPTEPRAEGLVLSSAAVVVDGQPVNGGTVERGHGASTRFEARLHDHEGRPAMGHTVEVLVDRPGHHGRHQATLRLHDDGTHGDATPGDGLYCYEDVAGDYGCHGSNAPLGEHHWEFFGHDHEGHESNHVTISVTVAE